MSNGAEASPVVDVEVTTHGDFPGIAEYARTKIGGLARIVHRPILRARVRLTRSHDPAVERPVVAQGNLDVQGRPVRAQVEADTAQEAIDKLESRLRRRLEHLAERWEAPRGPEAAPPWRNGEEPARAPRSVTSSTGEPRIIRRKSFAMAPCTIDDAVAEMELLDYDFHLFTESGSETAGVVYRGGPTGYRVALVAPAVADEVAPYQDSVTISPQPAPCLREQDALERMALLGLPFLFFIDAAQGRASLLYRRYDGAYGLITPAG
ncbi:ribosome hibernation promotion factor [Mycolicibacterium vanbaalenii]|uniref:ribosome hibernation promotion factor n=1 Tax=Mycolicibacterium vanbaalenii TaxID=110539 RepID=UPI0021F30A1D|nr:HPF/RaiA family ribosome-associated protein [Mycolicibacterium vanbaalenii]MCV7127262.1 HPF/RaiA family ribosome-associated protein [Mycolicibacterium vanbaalenii PYR-1]